MTMESESLNTHVTVAVHDNSHWLLGRNVPIESALTLLGILSEDPHDWTEIQMLWPRYRTAAVPEYFSSLDFEASDLAEVRANLEDSEDWLFVDVTKKWLCTGVPYELNDGHATFSLTPDAGGKSSPLSIRLPPWWETTEHTTVASIDQGRQQPLNIPSAHRDVLWGPALAADLASRILQAFHTDEWRQKNASNNTFARYRFTIAVHRDWLMTPRVDLKGKTPRACLHGGIDWIDSLCDSQRLRIVSNDPSVAIPVETYTYRHAPPGRDEVCIYFDLCRHLIDAGWEWCSNPSNETTHEASQHRLTLFLDENRELWMNSPLEYDSPPSVIVECNRRRVMRGSGFSVVGMTDEEVSESHITDCDCPICDMMAEGLLGPGFTSFDGHHLELDDEFAFSLYTTREEWEQEQLEFNAYSNALDQRRIAEEAAKLQAPRDEFASVWDNVNSDAPQIGGPYLRLAFMLAEIISVLQRDALEPHEPSGQSKLPRELTQLMANFREAEYGDKRNAANRLKEKLETVAQNIPSLTPRVADFQSHLDEALIATSPTAHRFFDDDTPF